MEWVGWLRPKPISSAVFQKKGTFLVPHMLSRGADPVTPKLLNKDMRCRVPSCDISPLWSRHEWLRTRVISRSQIDKQTDSMRRTDAMGSWERKKNGRSKKGGGRPAFQFSSKVW